MPERTSISIRRRNSAGRSSGSIVPRFKSLRGIAVKKARIGWTALILFSLIGLTGAQEKGKYPAPRFPSYVRPPKSIDDVMPFARAAVRQTGGRTPLGLVEQGQKTTVFSQPAAAQIELQRVKR